MQGGGHKRLRHFATAGDDFCQVLHYPFTVFCRIFTGKDGGDVTLAGGQAGCLGIKGDFHDGVEEFTVPKNGFPGDGPAIFRQVLPEHGGLDLALEDHPVAAVPEPGGGFQNGDHGVSAHAGADQGVEIPGDILDAVRQAEFDFFTDAELGRIVPGALEGTFPEVGGNGGRGDALGQQVDGKIAVVTTHVGDAVTGVHEGTTGQKTVRNGEFHRKPPYLKMSIGICRAVV